MKFLQTAVLFASFLAIAYAANASWGNKGTYSYLASTQNVTISRVNGQFLSALVNYPASGQTNTRILTYINVLDRFTNSSGPVATLWSGGPNFTFATINLKSQLSQGINVTVQFWVRN